MTRTILLQQNFVLSKMSDESEHSESEFYYLGELSDAELLQSPTHSESKEKSKCSLSKLVNWTNELKYFLDYV